MRGHGGLVTWRESKFRAFSYAAHLSSRLRPRFRRKKEKIVSKPETNRLLVINRRNTNERYLSSRASERVARRVCALYIDLCMYVCMSRRLRCDHLSYPRPRPFNAPLRVPLSFYSLFYFPKFFTRPFCRCASFY